MAEARHRQRTATRTAHCCSRWKGSTPASPCGLQRTVHVCSSCTRSGWRVLSPPKSRRCCTPATGAWSPAQTAWTSSGDRACRAGGTTLSDTAGHCIFASAPGHAASCGAIFVVCEGVECLHMGEHFPSLLSLDCEKDPKEARDIPLICRFKKKFKLCD